MASQRQDYTPEHHFARVGLNTTGVSEFQRTSYGYRAALDREHDLTAVRSDPGVRYVEARAVATTTHLLVNGTEIEDDFTNSPEGLSVWKRLVASVRQATYGLQMIASPTKLANTVFDNGGAYNFVDGAGRGVTVYVFDSGIKINAFGFQTRASHFGGLSASDNSPYTPEVMDDLNGHGTRMASTIGGMKFGVAQNVNLVNVKVSTRLGAISLDSLADAINDVTKEHVDRKSSTQADPWNFRGSVINMSFGTKSDSRLVKDALRAAVDAGITVAAAAGNFRESASNEYPCAYSQYYPAIVCIGSVDSTYTFSTTFRDPNKPNQGSNYGLVLDYLAPGWQVQALGLNGIQASSGTSCSTAHVSGVLSIFTSWLNAVDGQAYQYLGYNAIPGLISSVPQGTTDLLLDTGIAHPQKGANEPFNRAGSRPSGIPNLNAFDGATISTVTDLADQPIATGPAISDLTWTAVDVSTLPTASASKTTSDDSPPPTSTSSPGGSGQQIALASYTNPLADPSAWDRLVSYDSSKVSVLVANVLNGPDYVVDPAWQSVIGRAAASGKTVLGYVRTGYLGVSVQQFTTRLGSANLADWASQIEQDVDKWFELYGDSLGGIFFDEGWPECGDNNIYADLYAYINQYTKRKHPGAYTVLNPGSPIAQCFEQTMDTLLTFESSYGAYTTAYVPNAWTPADPRKIWHIIYGVPQDQVASVAALAVKRGAGLVEVTDDVQPNPYDNVPSEAYMQTAMSSVPGGKPRIYKSAETTGSYIAGLPADSAVESSDYSSVTLTWSQVANALGYAVYVNGAQALELPGMMTRATVGMIEPGTSGIAFEVRTILSSGSGGSPRSVTASTMSLPPNGTIINAGVTINGRNAVYTADVLVPYAFVRLFIGGPEPDLGVGSGWPIQVPGVDDQGTAYHKLVDYLVEGNSFYSGFFSYSGSWNEASKIPADWSWSSLGQALASQSGYTYTWKVPLAGTNAIADQYVVQGQGYAPITNVFVGDVRSYLCTSLFGC